MTDARQQALEILGKAINEILPEHRATGDVVAHATKTAEALLREFKRLKADYLAIAKLQAFIMDERDAARLDRAKVRDELDSIRLASRSEG